VLFGLLFWDIIFAPVAGAFETPFQSAPLDLGDETFFHARADLVLECLEKLENKDGFARDHVAKIDADHRDKNTLCVGVHWKRWEREDLLDMVDVRINLVSLCPDPYD
jgi:Fanconi-associated nuclease 1